MKTQNLNNKIYVQSKVTVEPDNRSVLRTFEKYKRVYWSVPQKKRTKPVNVPKQIDRFLKNNKDRVLKCGYDVPQVSIQEDGTINIDGTVILKKKDFVNGKLPFSMGVVNGDFICKNLDMGWLMFEGFPHTINGDFDCSGSIIWSMDGWCPKIIGDFIGVKSIVPRHVYWGKWLDSPDIPKVDGEFIFEVEPKDYHNTVPQSKFNLYEEIVKQVKLKNYRYMKVMEDYINESKTNLMKTI